MEISTLRVEPYNERYKLYTMHSCFAFASRMWDLGIVLIIATITNNSLFLVAMIGFTSSLLIFLLMPVIGVWMDRCDRLVIVQYALMVKVLVVSLTLCLCYSVSLYDGDQHSSVILLLMPVFAALVSVCFSTVTQSVEKDWLVQLSCDDSVWLSETNSTMSQIDLFCAALAPALTGGLFGWLPLPQVIVVLLCSNGVTTLLLMCFLRTLYLSWPALAQRNNSNTSETHSSAASKNSGATGATAAEKRGVLSDFAASGCAGVMLSYALLYVTCLSFGSIMIVYLRWAGVSSQAIGFARGAAALVGCVGAATYPLIKSKAGLQRTAHYSLGCQMVLAVGAASTFLWRDRHHALLALMGFTLFMRTWIFDLSVRQIAQETIHESIRGRVNGQWRALMALSELTGFALAMALPDPRHFVVLASVSAAVMTGSFVLFTCCSVAERGAAVGGTYHLIESVTVYSGGSSVVVSGVQCSEEADTILRAAAAAASTSYHSVDQIS